jgi:chloride channel 3/4/5
VGYLLLATSIRLSLSIITFGSKVPAGIFIPCLSIGACLGRAVGLLTSHLAVWGQAQGWTLFAEVHL